MDIDGVQPQIFPFQQIIAAALEESGKAMQRILAVEKALYRILASPILLQNTSAVKLVKQLLTLRGSASDFLMYLLAAKPWVPSLISISNESHMVLYGIKPAAVLASYEVSTACSEFYLTLARAAVLASSSTSMDTSTLMLYAPTITINGIEGLIDLIVSRLVTLEDLARQAEESLCYANSSFARLSQQSHAHNARSPRIIVITSWQK